MIDGLEAIAQVIRFPTSKEAAAAVVAQSVKRPELRPLKEVQLN